MPMASSASPTSTADAGEAAAAADCAAVDRALRALAESCAAELPAPVAGAIGYSLLGEGKRLRPLVVLAYSLVHDDLPCMDDDEVRRGRPTTHRVHGARVATVAGVAMVPLAARAAFEAAR